MPVGGILKGLCLGAALGASLFASATNAGGAIIKDKLFIFGGYEHLLRGLPSPNTINPAAAGQLGIDPALLAEAPAVQHAQFLNLRADWVINQKHQAFVRYNYFRNEFPFNTGTGALNTLEAAADFAASVDAKRE